MPAAFNPFDAFTVTEIQEAINLIPNNYGRLGQLGLFPVRGSVSHDVAIEERNGVLALLPTDRTGGYAEQTVTKMPKRRVRSFRVPKIVHDDMVSPEDVHGLRRFGDNNVEVFADYLNEKLAVMRSKHDITLEWLRVGALRGVILDADGSVIYDLFDEFGVDKKTAVMGLNVANTKVLTKVLDLKRYVEQNMAGEVFNRIHVLASPEFFDAFTTHASVERAFEGYMAAQQRLATDQRTSFEFGGITVEEYNGRAVDPSGTVRRFIEPGHAQAFPVGTVQTFRTYAAPADFNETVGRPGDLYYAKTAPAKFDRGIDIHTQANPLPLCLRPGVLVDLAIE